MKKQMYRFLSLLIATALLMTQMAVTASADGQGAIRMSDFRVCALKEPLGIDENPIFSWVLTGDGRDQAQSSYRIHVSTTHAKAEAGEGDVWDSGVVESRDSFDIAYGGDALTSKTTYYWTAESTVDGKTVQSDVQIFTTGILNADEWQGEWIGRERMDARMDLTGANWIWRLDGGFGGAPAGNQYFRKTFIIRDVGQVKKVLIGYTADDEAVLYFNGVHSGETSAWSTGGLFDATKSVVAGENTVAIAAHNATAGYAGMLAKIIIEFTDGTAQEIVSDQSWTVSKTEQTGWETTGYDDANWQNPDQSVAFGSDPWGSGVTLELYGSRAAVMARKEFEVKGEVAEAYAYICGLGFFELTVNGHLPDDSLLNPFTSQYNKRVLYRTFDVTELLQDGQNAIGVELGNSYYNEIGGVWNWQGASWRDDPKVLLNLVIRYTDGSTETVVTDTDWTVTNEGPITANSMYYGETYDARKEQTGWNRPGFDDGHWDAASIVDAPTGTLSAQMRAPIKRVAEFKPAEIKKLDEDTYVLTAPEMVAGWIKLMNIVEPAGQKITVTYGQRLNEDGTVVLYGGGDGQIGHWWPHDYLQQDKYICKGTGEETFEPKFSYKGHLYIQIDGYTGDLTETDVTIYRVSNGVDTVSSFSSSNELLNQLHQMMHTAMANNFQGEHCDPVLEKCGWTGDANVSLGTLMYNFDMTGSLPQWLQTMEDCLEQYGTVTVTAPTADWWIDNTIVWNSLYVYGVQDLEAYYGTGEFAAKQYETLRDYTLGQIEELRNNGWVWRDDQLGDWVAPIGGSDPDVAYNENISEGSGITGTAFAYGVLDYMADLADRLGRADDAAEYRAAMEKLFDAFQQKFYKADKGYYETNTWTQIGSRTRYRQTDNLVALAFGLVPAAYEQTVLDRLLADIKAKDYHLDTGCVGTRYILPVLTDYGYGDVAYRILTQTTYPSWGFWVENGATSTWEMWESTTRSFDHYFLGTYDEYFYSHLAGITDITDGYTTYTVEPGILGDLTEVDAAIDTVRGQAAVHWMRSDSDVSVTVKVPMGSEAKVLLPTSDRDSVTLDGAALRSGNGVRAVGVQGEKLAVTVGSGEYTFVCSGAELPVYTVALEQAIAELESHDTAGLDAATKSAVEAALNTAKALLTAASATQTQVNGAVSEIEDLLLMITGSETRQALSARIAELERTDLPAAYYSAESVQRYDSALLTAKKLCGSRLADDTALATAGAYLEAAYHALSGTKRDNLALGKTATASSTNDDSYWNWGLSLINDGTLVHESLAAGEYTGYCSNLTPNEQHTEWVSIDLGQTREIGSVVIYSAASLTDGEMMGYGLPLDFKIQVSDDLVNWTTVHEETDYPVREFGPLTFTFAPTQARYVRLYADKLRTKPSDMNSYRMQIAEMEIYAPVDDAPAPLLSYIELDAALVDPVFHPDTTEYTADIAGGSARLTLWAADGVSLSLGGEAVENGAPITVDTAGEKRVTIAATVGEQTVIYTLTILKPVQNVPGDVDESGKVDVADIMKLKALIMADKWTAQALSLGDMDQSGKLDVGDIMAIKNVIMSA